MIKSFQLCGNMMVKNCFSSQFFYEPNTINHKAKQSHLKCTARLLPRELSYPVNKDESWYDKYDFIMIPTPSSTDETSNEIFNVRLQTPREINSNENDSTRNTQRSISSSLPLASSRINDDGIHLFVNPNNDSALPTDRSQISDPILRLRRIIGLGNCSSLLWTQDGNYILYPSNAIVVQMHIDTQQQLFFIGHTDKVTAIAFNGNSSLLATTQAGSDGKEK
jgi:hypothetical protein